MAARESTQPEKVKCRVVRPRRMIFALSLALVAVALASIPATAIAQEKIEEKQTDSGPDSKAQSAKSSSEDEALRKVVDQAGSDRVALVRGLEAYLQQHPESPRRLEIYRALVESDIQLRDTAHAAEYAERMVALAPGDISMTLLAIRLLQNLGDEDGLRRATSYATSVLDYVQRHSTAEKSPKVSPEEWNAEVRHSRMTVLVLRGRLYFALKNTAAATRDFQESYALSPNALAAEQLGEIAELQKDLPRAIEEYARAFILAGSDSTEDVNRQAIRRKLGNVWRLAHGTEEGLGEFLLRAYDEINLAAATKQTKRNSGVHEVYDFSLRRIPDGSALELREARGKVLVLNFWATWCGPCRALEPLFEHVAAGFKGQTDVLFIAVNCDEDEQMVADYLKGTKITVPVAFSDGLAEWMSVQAFPTVVALDRAGKTVYNSDGYGDDQFEEKLAAAVREALAVGHSPRP